MKKFKLLAVLLCVAVSTACLFACTRDSGQTKTVPETTLDLFENKSLTLIDGLEGPVEWSSSDETVVTVKDGLASAEGKEGTATITAKAGKLTVNYPVTVSDSGDRPVLTVVPVSVYKGKTADLKGTLSLTYMDKPVESGVTYSYNALSEIVTVDANGVLHGVTAGTTRIQVRATYKGFTTAQKAVTVTVEESDVVKPKTDEISLSTIEGDVDPTSAEIEAEVFVNAEKVENASITTEIESGAEYIELDGLTIRAKAVGKAVVKLIYDNNGTQVTGTLKVNVHDDTVEYKAGALLKSVGASTFTKVFDGDFKDCYEYKLGKTGNYWYNAVIESSSLDSIIANGYKSFSFDIYFADSAALVAYIPSSFPSSSGAYCMYDLSTVGNKYSSAAMKKYTGDDDLLHIYGDDGKHLADGTELVTSKWYTVVYDLSTYTDGWSMMGLSLNVGETPNGQTSYLKNFAFHTTANLLPEGTYDERHPIGEIDDPEVTDEKDEFINNLTIGSKAVTVKKVTSGAFQDAYKIRSQTSASSGSITFNDIHNNMFEPQSFFTEGYHYIKFDLYIQSGNGLGICNWIKGVDGKADVKLEMNITSTATEHETVRIYNSNGNISPLSNGSWYTVLVNVPYDEANLPEWDLFYIGLTGSKYAPAVGYIKNMEYLKEDPEIVGDDSEIATKLTAFGTLTKQAEAVDGVEGAYLYENEATNWYEGRLEFEAEKHVGKVISLKLRFCGDARPYYSVNWVNSCDRNGWTFDKNIHYFDGDGKYVKTTQNDVWYTLIVDLSGSKDWINYITIDKGASMYIADLRILDESPYDVPEEDTSNIAKYFSAESVSTIEKVGAYEGVEGAYKYTNNGNWYTGRINVNSADFKGKYVSIKVRNEYNGVLILGGQANSVTALKNVKIYTLDGKKAALTDQGTWYEIVVDYTDPDAVPAVYWSSYLEGGLGIVTYFADLRILDENPYADVEEDTSAIAKMITTTDSLVKQKQAVDGVEGAYLYTNTTGWWNGRLDFGQGTAAVTGKAITLKVRLNAEQAIYCAINYANSHDKGESWTFDDNIRYYNADRNLVKALAKDVWYTMVVDLTGSTNWLWYISTDAGSMYIADLRILDENPYADVEEDTSAIAKMITTTGSLVKQKQAVDGVEGAYLYTNTSDWYSGRLDFGMGNKEVTGKAITLKVRLNAEQTIHYAVNYVNSCNSGADWTFGDKIAYYDADGKVADKLSKDVWYTVVIDLTGSENWFWYITLDGGSMYIADLQILDSNPYNA